MSNSVVNTLKVMDDVKKLVLDAAVLIKGGPLSFLAVGKIVTVFHDIQALIEDVPNAFPELSSLSGSDIGKLGEEAYSILQSLIASLGAPAAAKVVTHPKATAPAVPPKV